MERNKTNILLGVTGGIAAYKAIDLASRLVKLGFDVKTVLTANAQKFVSGLNFEAITGNQAYTDMFGGKTAIPHIALADWADLLVIAPATTNLLAKATHGIADDLLSTLLLAHSKPVLWVPAMNVHMYEHPVTQANLTSLKNRGHHLLEPMTGMLACGYEGRGKYPPNEEVVYAIRTYLNHGQDFTGKKVLVSAGGTTEPIDPMRVITNRSSGKTGLALARAAALRGAETYLVYGNITQTIPYYLKQAVSTPTVESMHREIIRLYPEMDIVLMAAAVSDYTLPAPATAKIKKAGDLSLTLVRTSDILAELGKLKQHQKLIGFAAETDDLVANARKKLQAKHLDMIVANHLRVSGQDETEQILITATGQTEIHADKFTAAHLVLDAVLNI